MPTNIEFHSVGRYWAATNSCCSQTNFSTGFKARRRAKSAGKPPQNHISAIIDFYFYVQYFTVEEPVCRRVYTSSSIAAASKLRGFEVIPEEIVFGILREGSTYTYKFALKNTGIDSSHFKIKQPPPSTGIKVIYSPGPVSCSAMFQTG